MSEYIITIQGGTYWQGSSIGSDPLSALEYAMESQNVYLPLGLDCEVIITNKLGLSMKFAIQKAGY